MVPSDNKFVEEFDKSLEAWTDSRMVSRDQVRAMTMFLLYLVNLADEDGWTYDGHSWKESSYLGCLVVKATCDGVPSVVFTNAATATAAMAIFLRKMEAKVLEWVPDRYRG